MFPREFAALVHVPLPLLHVAAMVFLEPRETERPGVKRGELRDNSVYFVLDLLGALGERRNVFLPDVILDPVPPLRPMPSIANMLDSFLPIWLGCRFVPRTS
jgi:hypothetical protein